MEHAERTVHTEEEGLAVEAISHLSGPGKPGRAPPSSSPAPYLAPFHVLHVHGVLHALALLLLVLLLLATAFLADAEAAGEQQETSNHSHGDQSPGWHCPHTEPQHQHTAPHKRPHPKQWVGTVTPPFSSPTFFY